MAMLTHRGGDGNEKDKNSCSLAHLLKPCQTISLRLMKASTILKTRVLNMGCIFDNRFAQFQNRSSNFKLR
jgi:hypothetical protein